jgi:putative transcriptional regulator
VYEVNILFRARIVYYTHRGIVRDMIRFKLDRLLKDRDWSAYRLAKESGIHPNVLSKYINNQVREISLETLNVMCAALKCQPGELIQYVRDKKS